VQQKLFLSAEECSLLTDLYQLTMTACYVGEGIEESRASFELFVRKLPDRFGYLIAMGLQQALEYLESLSFTDSQIEALQATEIFKQAPDKFWSILRSGKFTGDVWAVPEGTAIFANEPILRIEAPLWQAQIVETYLLNTINYQTLIATKAARIRDVAGEDAKILEFGARRAFSPQGALWAARAALAGGLDSTSNVLAALQLGIKPSGTMAHALVMAIKATSGSEDDAFAAFHRYFPKASLLIDTYDTINAAARLAEKISKGEIQVGGVRIDSGNFGELSQKVRSLLPNTRIFASGDLDEWAIRDLKQNKASIDGYGIGTKLVTGNSINGVYKLVEIDDIPTVKLSSSKKSYPGRKQIFRKQIDGQIISDRLGLVEEKTLDSEQPLLQLVMKEGKRVQTPESLEVIRERTFNSVASLSDRTRDIDRSTSINVEISEPLESLYRSLAINNKEE
jgi:nicotinate phosphoribosyltransferase